MNALQAINRETPPAQLSGLGWVDAGFDIYTGDVAGFATGSDLWADYGLTAADLGDVSSVFDFGDLSATSNPIDGSMETSGGLSWPSFSMPDFSLPDFSLTDVLTAAKGGLTLWQQYEQIQAQQAAAERAAQTGSRYPYVYPSTTMTRPPGTSYAAAGGMVYDPRTGGYVPRASLSPQIDPVTGLPSQQAGLIPGVSNTVLFAGAAAIAALVLLGGKKR